MNWHKGNIGEAVAEAKTKNAIFVVYVEGKDESSTKLTSFLNDTKIQKKLNTNNFVAIKIESDSQSYVQFASIYQVVPVPSIFFIGATGTPLEIGTGVLGSVDELDRKIETVLVVSQKANASGAFLASERTAAAQEEPSTSQTTARSPTTDEVVCEDGVCYKKPKATDDDAKPVPQAEAPTASATNQSSETLEHVRKMLEQKRIERVEAEKKLEKEQELRRRHEQKELQKLNDWKKDQEYKEAIENRRRERMEEKAAREKILAKIAADKAERAQKFAVSVEAKLSSSAIGAGPNAAASPATGTSSNAPDATRLQFRFPNGDTHTQAFQRADTLASVRDYIKSELTASLGGLRDFALATTYPKREFVADDEGKTLTELALFPSAVVLVLSKTNRGTAVTNASQRFAIFTFLMQVLMSPFLAIYNYFTKARTPDDRNDTPTSSDKTDTVRREAASKRRRLDGFSGKSERFDGGAEHFDDDTTLTRRGPSSRRFGGSNIHRLSDSPKDSDDENATWNGNSTQQQ